MRDKSWHDELARKVYVGILELMTKPAVEGRSPTRPRQTSPSWKLTGPLDGRRRRIRSSTSTAAGSA